MKPGEIEATILKVCGESRSDTRISRGRRDFGLIAALRDAGLDRGVNSQQVMEATWSLLGRGLIYFDMSQPSPENWPVHLTSLGAAALAEEQASPLFPPGYLKRLGGVAPSLGDALTVYVREALTCFDSGAYIASVAMIGVAVEGATLKLADGLADTLTGSSAKNLRDVLSKPGAGFIQKFRAFRKRLEPEKGRLPSELAGDLDLMLNAAIDLVRKTRNEAGHPTGVVFSREDALAVLVLAVPLFGKIHAVGHALAQPPPP